MAQTQLLRRRIKSIGNTRQITKAMEVVAAVKMRHSQERVLKTRPYATSAQEAFLALYSPEDAQNHPLFRKRPLSCRLIILISSDRGLAGAYNTSLFKQLIETLQEHKASKTKLIVVGQKGIQFAKRLTECELIGIYPNWPAEPKIQDIRPILTTVIHEYVQETVDQVDILFTHFTSSLKQTVALQTILPITPQVATTGGKPIITTTYEPSPHEVIEAILPRLLEVIIYQATLDASASEHSMRMLTMKNATDNATSLIDDLTLTYNSARQAAITQELAEITSGAEAIQL